MKVLALNIHLLLPDDFEGGLNEALEFYIKYRKDKDLPPVPEYDEDNNEYMARIGDMSVNEYHTMMYEEFLSSIETGHRVHGEVFLGQYNKEVDEWESLIQ